MKNPRDLLMIGLGFLLGMVVCYFLMSNEPAASVAAPTNQWRIARITNQPQPFRGLYTNGAPLMPPKPNILYYDKLHPQPKPDFIQYEKIHFDRGMRWGPQPNVVWPDDAPLRRYDQPLIDFRYQSPSDRSLIDFRYQLPDR